MCDVGHEGSAQAEGFGTQRTWVLLGRMMGCDGDDALGGMGERDLLWLGWFREPHS